MQRWLTLLVVAGCSRDLAVPEAPVGKLRGRALYAVTGSSQRQPAAGAVATFLPGGVSVQANLGGVFTFENFEWSSGSVVVRFASPDGAGRVDRQRVFEVADFNAGPGRSIDIGDVLLGENAGASGRVLLADQTSHAGTTVFVPEGPFTATTGGDGTFRFTDLPPGTLQFFALHSGYEPVSMGAPELRSGEDFRLREVTLRRITGPEVKTRVFGQLGFSEPVSGLGDTAVRLLSSDRPPLSATLDANLAFMVSDVPPGLYDVEARRSGFRDAVVRNVLVLSGVERDVGRLLLAAGPGPDGGGGAGGGGGGAGGGAGGGTGAGGGGGAGGCLHDGQCASTQWCDEGQCVPRCSATVACTLGRQCELATGICLSSCDAGCPSRFGCDTALNLCRRRCDGSFPCSAGQRCNAGALCVAECAVSADCGSPFRRCAAGLCVPTGDCGTDLDCSEAEMCLADRCTARPTSRSDGGSSPFSCTVACDCRMGESCQSGVCGLEPVPTMRFASDAGADSGVLPASALASTLSQVVSGSQLALHAGDRFYSDGPFRLVQSNVHLSGGWVACSQTRWVKDRTARSLLATDAGVVFQSLGTAGTPVLGVGLSGVELQPRADLTCDTAQVSLAFQRQPALERIFGAFPRANCVFNTTASLVELSQTVAASVLDVRLTATDTRSGNAMRAVALAQSSGRIQRVSAAAPSGPAVLTLVFAADLNGALEVTDSAFPSHAGTSANGAGIEIFRCSGSPVAIERNTLGWVTGDNSPGAFSAIDVKQCDLVTIRDNRVLGASALISKPEVRAVALTRSGGVVSGNRIDLLATAAGRVRGIYAEDAVAALAIDDNDIRFGATSGTVHGIALEAVTTANSVLAAPIAVRRNFLDVGQATDAVGISNVRVETSTGPSITDNFIIARGDGKCGSTAVGISTTAARGAVERNRAYAMDAQHNRGIIDVGQGVGATRPVFSMRYASNHLFAGDSACGGDAYGAVVGSHHVNGSFEFLGNTIEGSGTALTAGAVSRGFGCFSNDARVVLLGNIVGGGRASDHRVIDTNVSCAPTIVEANYFWHEALGPPSMPDLAAPLVDLDGGAVRSADGGIFGNWYAGSRSPFDSVQPKLPDGGPGPAVVPAAGSFVVDRGGTLRGPSGAVVTFDLLGKPRDAGQGPDIGCWER